MARNEEEKEKMKKLEENRNSSYGPIKGTRYIYPRISRCYPTPSAERWQEVWTRPIPNLET